MLRVEFESQDKFKNFLEAISKEFSMKITGKEWFSKIEELLAEHFPNGEISYATIRFSEVDDLVDVCLTFKDDKDSSAESAKWTVNFQIELDPNFMAL